MAITGKFVADFTDFDRQVPPAKKKVEEFETAADRAGGRLMDLGRKGEEAMPGIGGLAGSMKSFDAALGAVGLHIGPQIRALSELQDIAGKTASQLGAVATAGGLLASALTGWQLGRIIADFTGTDKVIGDFVANLFGWSDAAERAGAKADVLARASKNAGREITDFSEAVKINAQAAEDLSLRMGRSANVTRDASIEVANWQREIRQVRKDGNFDQLTTDMESQNVSLQKLSVRYGIHVEALQYLQRQMKEAAEVSAAANAAAARAEAARAAAEKEALAFQAVRWKQQLELDVKIVESTQKESAARLALTNGAVLKELEAKLENTKATEQEINATTRLEAAQKSLQATKIAGFSTAEQELRLMNKFGQELMDEAIAEERARFAAQGVNDEAAKLPAVMDPATASISNAAASAQQAASSFFSMSAELYNAIRAAQLMDEASGRFGRPIFTGTIGGIMPHFAAGGPVMRDGPIYAHAGEYVLPKGSGGGSVTINYYGTVLTTKAELGRAIKEAVTAAHMSGGGRMPA